jgi:hypothetical protein
MCIPRFGGVRTSERSVVQDFASTLNYTRARYEQKTGKKATGFKDFVDMNSYYPRPPFTIGIYFLSHYKPKSCSLISDTIFCSDFPKGQDTHYLWEKNGKIRCVITPTPEEVKKKNTNLFGW